MQKASQKIVRKIVSTIILIAVALVYYYSQEQNSHEQPSVVEHSDQPEFTPHQKVADYFDNKVSKKMVTIRSEVTKILSDDTHPPRHQRFIITLNQGLALNRELTVLISHNIDLAPRVSGLNVGDEVTITGQYEWNDLGGVIHWTHHDPQGRRDGGQIIHQGRVYR